MQQNTVNISWWEPVPKVSIHSPHVGSYFLLVFIFFKPVSEENLWETTPVTATLGSAPSTWIRPLRLFTLPAASLMINKELSWSLPETLSLNRNVLLCCWILRRLRLQLSSAGLAAACRPGGSLWKDYQQETALCVQTTGQSTWCIVQYVQVCSLVDYVDFLHLVVFFQVLMWETASQSEAAQSESQQLHTEMKQVVLNGW